MLLSESTARLQRALANFCRSGEHHGGKGEQVFGTREGRAEVYRDLIIGGIEDALARAYPIAKARLGEELWSQLVGDFFSRYNCSSPHLWQMPRELISFVKESHYRRRSRLPYLDDLLLFEWTEIEVFNMEDAEYPLVRQHGDLLNDRLVVNRECRILELGYPVFRPASDEELRTESEYRLLAYRHPVRLTVEFIELSPFFATVLEKLLARPQALENIINELTKCECVRPTPQMMEKVLVFAKNLNQAGMVHGFLKEQEKNETID